MINVFNQTLQRKFLWLSKLKKQPITYKLKDLAGEEITGSFYEQELQATDQDVFRVAKVLRRGPKINVCSFRRAVNPKSLTVECHSPKVSKAD